MPKPPKLRSSAKAAVVPGKIPGTARTQDDLVTLDNGQLSNARADFRIEELIRIILQKGYYVTWRKAIVCPCVTAESLQPRIDCTSCNASGFFYINPIQTQAIMSGLEGKKGYYRNLGEWVEGSSMATTLPGVRLGHHDSLEMVHSIMVLNEWVIKGDHRGKRSKLPEGFDATTYKIVRALHLFYEDAAQKVVQLVEGLHFKITKGWIEWLPAAVCVANGTVITVNYEFHPVWIVISHPHAVRDTVTFMGEGQNTAKGLPTQALVRLAYLTEIKVLTSLED